MKTIIVADTLENARKLGGRMDIDSKLCYSIGQFIRGIRADIVIVDGVAYPDIQDTIIPMVLESNGFVLGVLRS